MVRNSHFQRFSPFVKDSKATFPRPAFVKNSKVTFSQSENYLVVSDFDFGTARRSKRCIVVYFVHVRMPCQIHRVFLYPQVPCIRYATKIERSASMYVALFKIAV